MSDAARVAAHAKINLWLRILAREASGYHQIETLFARIALADDVVVRRTSGARSLDCSGPAMPADGLGPVEKNLAWRAAVLYEEASHWRGGFAIEIGKRIPVGGGLGGGSADAGAVLRAMDALHEHPLGNTQLMALAAKLGADVPFVTSVQPFALAWGRGERMLGVPAAPSRAVRLVVPSVAINTADAYRWLDDARAAADRALGPFEVGTHDLSDWAVIARHTGNDFEQVIAARIPSIANALVALAREPATITRMSGSGSTLFQILDRPPADTERTSQGVATSDGLVTSTLERVAEVERIA